VSTYEHSKDRPNPASTRAAAVYEAHLRAAVTSLDVPSATQCSYAMLAEEPRTCPAARTDSPQNRASSLVAAAGTAVLGAYGHWDWAAVCAMATVLGARGWNLQALGSSMGGTRGTHTPVAHAEFHARTMIDNLPAPAVALQSVLAAQLNEVARMTALERKPARGARSLAAQMANRDEAFARVGAIAVTVSLLAQVSQARPTDALVSGAEDVTGDPWAYLTDLGHVLAGHWMEVSTDAE
jgi:hypothetical protein